MINKDFSGLLVVTGIEPFRFACFRRWRQRRLTSIEVNDALFAPTTIVREKHVL
ncbi:MAG: hypothetical protein J6A79_03210 [Clostridia bacterium]|nr:hypothetical protein [Clostridia bacterium]